MTVAASFQIGVANASVPGTVGAGVKSASSNQGASFNSTNSTGSAAPAQQSFRSNWERMVAAFDNPAEEESSAASEVASKQTADSASQTTLSMLKGTHAGAGNSRPALQDPDPSPGTQSTQASAGLARATAARNREFASESAEEAASGTTSVGGASGHAKQSEYAKQNEIGRPSTAKTTEMQAASQPLTDTAIASFMTVPVQPATMVHTTASTAAHFFSMPGSESTPNSHGVIASINHATRSLASESMAQAKTELSAGSIETRTPVSTNPVSTNPAPANLVSTDSAAESPAMQSTFAVHSNVPTEERPAPISSRADSGQSDSVQASVSGGLAAAQSTPSAIDLASSSVEAASAGMQVAAAHSANDAPGVRGSHDNSRPNPAAVQGMNHQLNGATLDAATIRDAPAALRANPGAPIPAASGVSTTGTFSALDGASNSMHATWLHAGAHQAEAGFEDPALGWVSVKAGLNAGGINAVVVPGSAGASQSLGAHMAGLRDYLAEQHTPVDSLTLGTAQNSGSDAGTSQNLNQHAQQQGSHSGEDVRGNSQTVERIGKGSNPMLSAERTGLSPGEIPAILSGSSGRYISVLA